MQNKKHETPEFQVIRQNEANAKFFVASGPLGDQFDGVANCPVGAPPVMNSYSLSNGNGWF